MDRVAGTTISASHPNSIHTALNGDFVGRGATGIPTAGQNLGTVAFPWGNAYVGGLVVGGNAIDTSAIAAPANRVVSGVTRAIAGSNLNQFIVPDGAALEADINASPTNLVVVINGVTVTVAADATKTGLTAAPAANNTALINDALAADQYDSKFWGAPWHRHTLTMDTAGSEITALVGKWAAFRLAGVSTEYLLAYVQSATQLTNVYRGFFYDSTLAPVKATGFTDNDVLTLMKLTWWFVEDDGTTFDVTYTNPTWAFTAPSTPASGDYWYDMGNNQWNRHDGANFVSINRTFIGWTIQNTTACIGARSADSYATFNELNSLSVAKSTDSIVKASEVGATVNVAGTSLYYGHDLPSWNITTDLAPSSDMFDAAEQSSRFYYLYLKQNGDTVVSDIFPYHRRELYGWYHPYNVWRCVGVMFNDASSDIQAASSTDAQNKKEELFWLDTISGADSTNVKIVTWSSLYRSNLGGAGWIPSSTVGDQIHIGWPGLYNVRTVADIRTTTLTEYGYTLNETAADLTGNVGAVASLENFGTFVRQQGTTAGGGLVAVRTHQLFMGDILRGHLAGSGAPAAGSSSEMFQLSKVD